MSRTRMSNIYGNLELLILKTLSSGEPRHGLEIAEEIRRQSKDRLTIEEGALYPALQRLQGEGLIEGEWRISEKRRRAKFYDLTPAGREELRKALMEWAEHTGAVISVLGVSWGDLR